MPTSTRILRLASLSAVALLLACAVTWPVAREPGHLLGLVLPDRVDHQDGLHFVGYVARSARALQDETVGVLDVAIEKPQFTAPPAYLYPAAALSLVAGGPVVAHNAMLALYVALAFLCMFAFARSLGAGLAGAAYAALFFGGCNYLVHHVVGGHANQSQIFQLPLAFVLLERVLARPSFGRGALLGASLALCIQSSAQYAVFLSILVPVYALLRGRSRLRDGELWLAALAAFGTTLVLAGVYMSIKAGAGTIPRSLYESNWYSVQSPLAFFAPDDYAHLGLVPVLLATAAVVLRRDHAAVPALAVVAVLSVAFSLGPQSLLHPYRWLYEVHPLVELLRTPVRFVAPAQMAILALAGIGISALVERLASRPRWRAAAVVGAFAVSLLSTPVMAPTYYRRSAQPVHIWAFDVSGHPDFPEDAPGYSR